MGWVGGFSVARFGEVSGEIIARGNGFLGQVRHDMGYVYLRHGRTTIAILASSPNLICGASPQTP
jgi:hypothetical protein